MPKPGSDNDGTDRSPPRLFEAAYEELKRIAVNFCRHERKDSTLQPTALVHEVYLRLVNGGPPCWQDRKHFLAIAARLMRQTLIDHIRWGQAMKRGGDRVHLALEEAVAIAKQSKLDLLALDEALEKLAELDSRKAEVIELRFFGSLSIQETAETLGVSAATVEADWYAARAWLRKQLEEPWA